MSFGFVHAGVISFCGKNSYIIRFSFSIMAVRNFSSTLHLTSSTISFFLLCKMNSPFASTIFPLEV